MSLKLLKSTSIVGSATFLSRISGLVRDVIFANILGDKAAADVFFIAFRIPNFFRRIFAEGAFSNAFIPVFTDYHVNRPSHETNSFLQILVGRFGLILILFCIFGVLFSSAFVTMLAAGFLNEPDKFDLAVRSARITFPYLFFISMAALCGAILNSCGRFAVPAAAPVLLNICLICAALFLVPHMKEAPIALSIGVIFAGFAQVLFQLPFLRREKLLVRPRVRQRAGDEAGMEGVTRVFKLTIPAIVGVSVAQINIIINSILASFLVTGSISWLYYSDRILEFPVGVFGIALSTVILPDLSRKWASKSTLQFSKTIDWGCRWAFLICVPASVAMVLLALPMVSSIYFHGDFTENGARMTAASLVAYSIGLLPIVLVKIFAPGFFARENTKTPVRIAMISIAVNIVFSLILVSPLKHVGLALSTSIASLVNCSLLFFVIRRENVYCIEPGWLYFLLKIGIATMVMAGVLMWMTWPAEQWLSATVIDRIAKLSILIVTGGGLYFALIMIMGITPRSMLESGKEN